MDIDLRGVVLGLTRADTVGGVAQTLSVGLATARSVVLARVWTVDTPGGELRLVGSAGTPSGGGSYRRLDGDFSRIQLGAGKIGALATTGVPHIVRGVRGDEDWLTNPAWSARQGVRAFLGYPLMTGHEIVGVLAVFDREMPSEAVLIDLPFLAAVAAARLSGLRERHHADTPDPSITPTSMAPPMADIAGPQSLGAPEAPDTAVTQEPTTTPEAPDAIAESPQAAAQVITRAELRWFEKQNITAALARTGGKVFGADGAAALLGMKPTTLASRIRALGIR